MRLFPLYITGRDTRVIRRPRPILRAGKDNLPYTATPIKLPTGIRKVTVFAPCALVLRQDVGRWTRFYVSEPEDCRRVSWTLTAQA